MQKMPMNIKLSVTFLREGDVFIAYSSALDLSTSGKTFNEAKKRFAEIVHIFFEELARRGTTIEVLQDLGWTIKAKKQFIPPIPVSHEMQEFRVPVSA